MNRILHQIANILGGYERLTCPHCNLHIRFRGVGDAEVKRLRASMADHVRQHTA